MICQKDILVALLLDALRRYVEPADLDSFVLIERSQVLNLSFNCTCQSSRIKRSAKDHRRRAPSSINVGDSLRANATHKCIQKLAEYVISDHSDHSDQLNN